MAEILERLEEMERVFAVGGAAARPRGRKIYKRSLNPLDQYDDNSFRKRYRFSKGTVLNVILPEVTGSLQKLSNRGLPISPLLQLLICLRFYATGSFQIVCGDLGAMAQSTVCRIVNRVSRTLALKMGKFVKFANNERGRLHYMQGFEILGRIGTRGGLQGIVGAIDCTHIRIQRPRQCPDTEAFRNRKGYFYLNVQVVCSPQMEILNIVTRWPGSTHDSRIFGNSRFRSWLDTDRVNGILVGDSGYASARYMLTPVINPQSPAEQRYNRCQIKTRNVIERLFGVWKRRFPCLQKGLANDLRNTSNIIVACAVLHNIALQAGDEWENVDAGELVDENNIAEPQAMPRPAPEGLAYRTFLIRRDFA